MTHFDKVIPPGQEGKIKASLKLTNVLSTAKKKITVTTNDPVTPSIKLEIVAKVKFYVSVKPSPYASMLTIVDQEGFRDLTLVSEEKKPFRITKLASSDCLSAF